jgi:hypothetical protein
VISVRKIYNVEIARVVRELRDKDIIGSRFIKFYKEDKLYRIKLRKNRRNFYICILFPYLIFIDEKSELKEEKDAGEKRKIPDSFAMCIRKNLKNSILTDIVQEDMERNLIFIFENKKIIFDFFEEKIELKENDKVVISIGKKEDKSEKDKEKLKLPEIYRNKNIEDLMHLKPHLYGDDYLIGEKQGEKGIEFESLLDLYRFIYKKIKGENKNIEEENKIKKLNERIKKQKEYIEKVEKEVNQLIEAGNKILSSEIFIKLFELVENERKKGKKESEILDSITSFLEKENLKYKFEKGKLIIDV